MELLLGLESSFEPTHLPENIQPIREASLQSNLTHQIASHQYQAAQAGSKAAMGELIPTVALMAATTSTKGQGPFTPTSQQYIGLSLQGDFQWGQKWMTYKQSQMDLSMAEQGLRLQESALSIEQQQLKQDWEASSEQIQLATERVEIESIKNKQAQAKFEAHQITTADLLDAEALFSDAQMDLLRSKHQHILAQAKYQQSLNADTLYFQ